MGHASFRLQSPSGSRQRFIFIVFSNRRIISSSTISFALLASLYPPVTPCVLVTNPASRKMRKTFCTNILLSPTAYQFLLNWIIPLCQQGIAYIAMHSQLSLLTACRTPSYLLPSKISVELHTIHNGYVI